MALHFGLGLATRVDKVEIKWPDGSLETVRIPDVDRRITIVQNKGIAK
jgi:hypothetical protein